MKRIIHLSENQKDLNKILDHIQKGFVFHLVRTINEVFLHVFDTPVAWRISSDQARCLFIYGPGIPALATSRGRSNLLDLPQDV
jgi:hypothetical protein